jgi:hypothetical protein
MADYVVEEAHSWIVKGALKQRSDHPAVLLERLFCAIGQSQGLAMDKY